MVSENESQDAANETTEVSNVTSLQSDISRVNAKPLDESADLTNLESNVFPQHRNCKCCAVHPYVKRDTKKTVKENTKPPYHEESTENQSPLEQFESSVPCACYAHKIPYTLPTQHVKNKSDTQPVLCRLNWKWPKNGYFEKKKKTYKVKLKPNQYPHYGKPFMCCEISEEALDQNNSDRLKIKYSTQQRKLDKKLGIPEKIDIYYFDHGNSAYYRTTDSPPILVTDKCAEKTDRQATRFWAEIFGMIHIGAAFFTAFILQFLRFLLYSIVRPLTVGILQLLADYFIKPLLSIIFNALIQPVLILLYNIATSVKDLCEPLAQAIGFFLRELANLCAAIRIVEVNRIPSTACT